MRNILGMRVNNKYYSRKWLNQKEGTAFIEASIEDSYSKYKDSTLNISDCNKKISLDFSFHTQKEKKEKLKKLDLLINELKEFKLALEKVTV